MKQTIINIFEELISDDLFCRLIYCGEDLFFIKEKVAIDKYDSNDERTKKVNMMKENIKFIPQTSDLQTNKTCRINMYYSTSNLRNGLSVIRDEFIYIDIYCPFKLANEEFRIYDIEEKIKNILDDKKIGFHHLSYSDGGFVPQTNADSNVQFRMIFETKSSRGLANVRL